MTGGVSGPKGQRPEGHETCPRTGLNPGPQTVGDKEPAPPVWVPDRQVLLPAPTSHCHRAETQVLLAPKNPFSPQQHGDGPRTDRRAAIPPVSVPPLPGHTGPCQSQTFTVHTCLPQTVFVKYQCICCPGGVPNSSCTIHTIHSFFLSVFYLFCFFRFFC